MPDNGRVAVVTGGSRGIGRAIASRLAQDGLAVIVNYAGSASEAEAAVRGIADAGGRAHAIKADVSDPAAVTEMFDETIARFGGVDVLVNNAGIMPAILIGCLVASASPCELGLDVGRRS